MAQLPFRLALLRRLQDALNDVTYTNADGTLVSLTGAVYLGKADLSDSDSAADVAIIEPPIAADAALSNFTNAGQKYPFNVLIQGFAREGVNSNTTLGTEPAYYLLSAIKMRLAKEKSSLSGNRTRKIFDMASENGNTLYEMHINTGVVRPPDESSSRCFCWLPVTFEVVESLDNPFVTY